jgi:localization factor PodJL
MSSERWDQTVAANIAMANSALGRNPRRGARADELDDILQLVASQLAETDRRQAEVLQLLQDRLDMIGTEADNLQDRLPNESRPTLDRITETIAQLAASLERSGIPSPFDDESPWDRQSADALADAYDRIETPEPVRHRAPSPSPAQTAHAPRPEPAAASAPADVRCNSDVDRAWIDEKLGEVAARLEQTLAEVRPDSAFFALGQRFDQLEDRIDRMMGSVATRNDVDGIGLLEAHLSEVEGNLRNMVGQLERLDSIESQLHVLAERVDASRYEGAAPGGYSADDVEAVASSAAERVVQRLSADEGADFISRHIAPMRTLLESISRERRQDEASTAASLETLQQAMLRVLDRIETMEMERPRSEPSVIAAMPSVIAAMPAEAEVEESEESVEPGDELELYDDVAHDEDDIELYDLTRYGNPLLTPSPVSAPSSDYDDAGADDAEADAEENARPMSVDEIRRDLVADLLRAKRQANLEEFEDEPNNDNDDSLPIKGGAGLRLKGRGARFASLRMKLLIGLVVLLMSGAAAAFAVKKTAAVAVQPVEPAVTKKMSALPRPAADTAEAGLSGAASEGRAVETASVPAGVTLHETEPGVGFKPRKLAQMSDTPGIVATRPTPVSLTPADRLAPTLIEKPGLSASVTATARSNHLDLPPATVGPLSLRLAAAKGDPSAEFEVAARLASGRGTDQDLKEAARWYQKAATQGFAQAQYRLGTLYERGLGLKSDIARARVWYQRAAEQGNVKAMHNLAVLSASMPPASPDYPAAARWFKTAADHGLPESQYNLAVLYEGGLGVERNLIEAYKWLAISARSGDTETARRRDYIKSVIGANAVAAADAKIASWRAEPADPLVNDARAAGEAWKSRVQSDDNS